MSLSNLKIGTWYWISGKGPMQFAGGCRFLTFAYGYNHWVHEDEVGNPLDQSDLDRHFDELSDRKIVPVCVSRTNIQKLRGFPPNKTLGEVSDDAFRTLDVDLVGISRFGVPITVEKLLSKIGE